MIFPFLQVDIQQYQSESKETYYKRIFKRHEDEDEHQYGQRIEEMKKRLHSLDVWKNEEYKRYVQVREQSSRTVAEASQSTAAQASSMKVVGRRSLVSIVALMKVLAYSAKH